MEARFNLYGNPVAASFVKRMTMASKVIDDSPLDKATYELLKIRASQINGCSYCVDMHTKDAAHAGESAVRINLVAAWREANVYTEAERAALALTEEATRGGGGGAPGGGPPGRGAARPHRPPPAPRGGAPPPPPP
ncbi:carboxymuconolactone decarboxylase family protein, partial [Nocardia neocaledoniensis]|uniref:carboxymuconolactone decarboxylase family protein n=1 Tax=Nocardia neocaledoniensis TaxID=236511 RepID=UPI002455AD15